MMRVRRLLLLFFVLAMMCSQKNCHALPVNAQYSSINFPHHLAHTNTMRPIITGSLLDDHLNPVVNESVTVIVNGLSLGTTVSNIYGIYEFYPEQDLPDGDYIVTVFCIESQVSLGPHTMTIDTQAPSITILSPTENEVISSTTFTVSGITEQGSMIETFLDDDTFGVLCYADELGNWSLEYEAQSGLHTVTARATDIAGNQGSLSAPRHFVITP